MSGFRTPDGAADEIFEGVLAQLNGRYKVSRLAPETGLALLLQFSDWSNYERLYAHNVTELTGATGSVIILLAEKHQTIIQRTQSGYPYQKQIEETEPVLIFRLPHAIGRASIRKETLGDKIAGLFQTTDIDFPEFPGFSKNYYLTANNPILLRQYLPKGLLQALEHVPGMLVEINGDTGYIRTEKNLTREVLLQLLSIGEKLVG